MKEIVKIDVTSLVKDEQLEVAKLLIKCKYTVRLAQEKNGNKYTHYIIAEKG